MSIQFDRIKDEDINWAGKACNLISPLQVVVSVCSDGKHKKAAFQSNNTHLHHFIEECSCEKTVHHTASNVAGLFNMTKGK